MHLLPFQLARLADLTDKRDGSRFALSNVSLRLNGDNTFTADVTDTKTLLRVSGPCADAADYPADNIPGFAAAPNGQTAALIPGDVWGKTFGAARKLIPARTLKARPELGNVAVKIGPTGTTFGATNCERHLCESASNGDGRFPPVADIIGAGKGYRDAFAVDPICLAELLRTMADVAADPETMRVTFSMATGKNAHQKPIHIRAERPNGIRATGIIMPLSDDGPTRKNGAELECDGADASAELAELRAALADAESRANTFRVERDAARKREDEYARLTETVTRERNELRDTVDSLRVDLTTYAGRVEMLRTERDELANRAAGDDGAETVRELCKMQGEKNRLSMERDNVRAELATVREQLESADSERESLRATLNDVRAELAELGTRPADVPPVPPAVPPVPPAELAELESALLQARAELNARSADLDTARAQLATVSRNLVVVEHNARDIVNDRDRLQMENARLVGRLTAGPVPPVPPAATVPPTAVPSSAGSPGARPLTRAERIALMKGVGA